MKYLSFVVLLIAATAAFAAEPTTQSTDETARYQAALDRLNQKSQSNPSDELSRLRAENARLKKQIEELKGEILKLRESLPSEGDAPDVEPDSTFTSRMTNHDPLREGQAWIERGERIDAKITAYARRNPDPKIVKAMYEGKPVPGMPEEAVRIIGSLQESSADTHSTTYYFSAHDFIGSQGNLYQYRITITDGEVNYVSK